ncbi:MAG: BamA/TamA family outer membrane protein [Bacteroides sp.]
MVLSIAVISSLCAQSNIPSNHFVSEDTVGQKQLTKRQIRRERVKHRNFHYNVLGGPSYTPDYGVLIGGSALMTFRMTPKDTTSMRSVLPVALAVTFTGGLNVMTRPQLFFNHDKFRIFGQFIYKNTLDNFYGVGYNNNKDYERGKETSEFKYSGLQINPWFMFRMKESNFFVGPQIDITYDKMKRVAKGVVENPSYIQAGGKEDGYRNFSSGIGLLATYDTRDVPANAYNGLYLNFNSVAYTKITGSDNNFYSLNLEYRQYHSVGKRKTIAWTVQSKNMFGNVPITRLSLSGTPFDLRGYYMGQYRDKTSHVVLAEYRQMFNTDKSNFVKRMVNHLGFVVWGGSGFMGSSPVKLEGVLPNFGAGLRIEVQPRMNVRLDIGRNTVNKQTLFYFNMTEAF